MLNTAGELGGLETDPGGRRYFVLIPVGFIIALFATQTTFALLEGADSNRWMALIAVAAISAIAGRIMIDVQLSLIARRRRRPASRRVGNSTLLSVFIAPLAIACIPLVSTDLGGWRKLEPQTILSSILPIILLAFGVDAWRRAHGDVVDVFDPDAHPDTRESELQRSLTGDAYIIIRHDPVRLREWVQARPLEKTSGSGVLRFGGESFGRNERAAERSHLRSSTTRRSRVLPAVAATTLGGFGAFVLLWLKGGESGGGISVHLVLPTIILLISYAYMFTAVLLCVDILSQMPYLVRLSKVSAEIRDAKDLMPVSRIQLDSAVREIIHEIQGSSIKSDGSGSWRSRIARMVDDGSRTSLRKLK